jgi:hypothetical protein
MVPVERTELPTTFGYKTAARTSLAYVENDTSKYQHDVP